MKASLFAALFLCALSACASPIYVVLSIDPVGVKDRMVKCTVVNNSKKLIKGWEGLDGKRNTLISPGRYVIAAKPVFEMEFEEAWIRPGSKQLLYEVPLNDVLLLNRPTNNRFDYKWDWYGPRPRGAAPMSPIHPKRGKNWEASHSEYGLLQAEVTLDGEMYTSAEITFSLKE